ncbi:uncharacterized protein LOC116187341 isoform X2 [Punica granatum]|uniref:Uncharacterized protein LOC116187341 isoform X2 n=1 Tax=Punica granatum TaxID=22663 RepID=A0A6P8BQF2_PUNGR|nr:uncharacterized protein LOC116187341 isoform X2 [Punica granatum]
MPVDSWQSQTQVNEPQEPWRNNRHRFPFCSFQRISLHHSPSKRVAADHCIPMELSSSSSVWGTRIGHVPASPKIFGPLQSQLSFPALTARPRRRSARKRSFWCMISNGYAGSGSFGIGNNGRSFVTAAANGIRAKIYRRLGSCLVIPPPGGRKPRAIIKFLGGAFIGAVPEVTYSYLKELLAKEGFLIISVPYNVTFDHAEAANEIYAKFNSCFDNFLSSGLPEDGLSAADLAGLPLFSVGHSNGALLQVLAGSYFSERIPKANAIISYNNRPATEAVPYFEQLGPLVSQMMPLMEASPVYSLAQNVSGDAMRVLFDTAGSIIKEYDQEALVSLTKFVDQLPSVFNQVTEGISEFRPTPSENRDFCKNSYNVKHTLLVKFNIDGIDETDLLEETLRPRVESIGGTLEKVELSGTHITPCIQDPRWLVGTVYTPADAIAQGLKTLSLHETRVLSRTISDWFRQFEK